MLQIDVDIVRNMTDDNLRSLGLTYGDSISLRMFAHLCQSSAEPASVRETQSSGALRLHNRIQQRLGMRRSDSTRSRMAGNKHGMKSMRRLEVGWKNYDSKLHKYVVVRPCKGGGTRHFKVPGSTTMSEMMQMASEVFSVQPSPDVKRKLVSFDDHVISDGVTVSDLYELKKVSLLRVYLTTCPSQYSETDNTCDDSDIAVLPDSVDPTQEVVGHCISLHSLHCLI